MRTFISFIILIALAWLIDVSALNGRYSQSVWQDAQYQGQKARNEVRRWINKLGL